MPYNNELLGFGLAFTSTEPSNSTPNIQINSICQVMMSCKDKAKLVLANARVTIFLQQQK